jgi:LmbE family N-acetylglucosaminyl deacetylase
MNDVPKRLLLVVAHPDDESFGCGSLLAYAAARNVRTVVCCATRGESGDSTVQLAKGETLGQVRERELRSAAALLGVEEVRVLDWFDSGMTGDPAHGSLANASLEDVSTVIETVVTDVRPDVLVTLDGSDGHRDHLRVRDATLAAVERSQWHVPRVYLSCLARSLMARWVEYLTASHPGSNYLELGELGTPDELITTVVDTSSVYDLRWQAIRAHTSQQSPFEILPPDLQREFLSTDYLRRIRPTWLGQHQEDTFL